MSNEFGKFSMTEKLFNFILFVLPDEKILLELGSGWVTQELSKHYNVYSVEDNIEWLNKYNSNYIHAPIVKYTNDYLPPPLPALKKVNQKYQSGWYDVEVLRKEMPFIKYNLLLVDGPMSRIGRGGFLLHIDLFDASVPIIVDDLVNEGEFLLLKKVASKLEVPFYSIPDETKIDEGGKHFFGVMNIDEGILNDFSENHKNIPDFKTLEGLRKK